jgi:hypothetical protein
MTKPAPPRAGQKPPSVVEMDAIDVAEWERDQHTPRAPSAGLAALVRQTLPQPSADEPQRRATQVSPTNQASQERAAQAPRSTLPPPRGPKAPRARVVPAIKRAGAPGTADKPSGAPPRVPPAASNDRPTPHAVVRQIAAQVRDGSPLASSPRSPRLPRVEPPMGDDPAIAPLRVPMLANDDRAVAPPRVSPLADDERDLSLPRTSPLASGEPASSPPHVSPFASTERLSTSPQVPPQPAPLRWPEPPSTPGTNPSAMLPSPVQPDAQRELGALSDFTPTPKSLGRASSSPRMDGTSPAIRAWRSSRRGIVISGAGLAAILMVVAVAATRGSAPSATPATTSEVAQASAVSLPSQPTHDAEAPQPTPRDATAAGATASAAAATDLPAEPSASKLAGPRSTTSATGPRKGTKIVALSSDKLKPLIEAEDDDVPATARARTAYNAGNQALFDGNSDAAIRAYRQALSATPTFPPGFRGLGLAYAQRGDNNMAIMSLRTYLTMAPHAKDVALIKQRIAALQASEQDEPADKH